MSSLVSVNGPSITVRCCPENLTRLPFELGCSPSPASITPAFTNSSLNFPMAAKVFLVSSVARTPASEFWSALTITMNRMVFSPYGSISGSEPGFGTVSISRTWALLTRRTRGSEIDRNSSFFLEIFLFGGMFLTLSLKTSRNYAAPAMTRSSGQNDTNIWRGHGECSR